jgi:hypothetical protein
MKMIVVSTAALAQFAEDKLRTGKRVLQQPIDGCSGRLQGIAPHVQAQNNHREDELQADSPENRLEPYGTPAGGESVCQAHH